MARKTTKSSAKKAAAKRPVKRTTKAGRKKMGTAKPAAAKPRAAALGSSTATKSIDLLRSWSPARYSTR